MTSWLEWCRGGGPLMLPVLLAAAAGLAVLVEAMVTTARRGGVHARPFMERVIGLTRAGSTEEALRLCAEHRSMLPDVGLVILRSHDDAAGLDAVAQAATIGVGLPFRLRLLWLRTLTVLVLLLGALGTVLNVHATVRVPDASPDVLHGAGLVVLRPLALALCAAVVLVAAHGCLSHACARLVAHAEEFSVRLVNALLRRADARLGHRD